MSRLAATVAQEIEDFQLLLVPMFGWGARCELVDDSLEAGTGGPGQPSFWAAFATVTDATLGIDGPLYQVFLGPSEALSPAADEDQPSLGLTLLLSDPIVDLRNGCFAIEVFTADGTSTGTWLRIRPADNPRDIGS